MSSSPADATTTTSNDHRDQLLQEATYRQECRVVGQLKTVQEELAGEKARWIEDRKREHATVDKTTLQALCVRKGITGPHALSNIRQRIVELEQFAVRVAGLTDQPRPRTFYISEEEALRLHDESSTEDTGSHLSVRTIPTAESSDSSEPEEEPKDLRGSTPTPAEGEVEVTGSPGAMSIDCTAEDLFPEEEPPAQEAKEQEKGGNETRSTEEPRAGTPVGKTPIKERLGPLPNQNSTPVAMEATAATETAGGAGKEGKAPEPEVKAPERMDKPKPEEPTGSRPRTPSGEAPAPGRYLLKLWHRIHDGDDARGMIRRMRNELYNRDHGDRPRDKPSPDRKARTYKWLDRLQAWAEKGAPSIHRAPAMESTDYRYLTVLLQDAEENRVARARRARTEGKTSSRRK